MNGAASMAEGIASVTRTVQTWQEGTALMLQCTQFCHVLFMSVNNFLGYDY
jgi:hypothetical protein